MRGSRPGAASSTSRGVKRQSPSLQQCIDFASALPDGPTTTLDHLLLAEMYVLQGRYQQALALYDSICRVPKATASCTNDRRDGRPRELPACSSAKPTPALRRPQTALAAPRRIHAGRHSRHRA